MLLDVTGISGCQNNICFNLSHLVLATSNTETKMLEKGRISEITKTKNSTYIKLLLPLFLTKKLYASKQTFKN